MQRELDTWRDENQRLSMALKQEEALTQKSIEPLKLHMQDLDLAIQEQLDRWVSHKKNTYYLFSLVSPFTTLTYDGVFLCRISSVKCNILKNEEKISKMIGSIGMPAFGKWKWTFTNLIKNRKAWPIFSVFLCYLWNAVE